MEVEEEAEAAEAAEAVALLVLPVVAGRELGRTLYAADLPAVVVLAPATVRRLVLVVTMLMLTHLRRL